MAHPELSVTHYSYYTSAAMVQHFLSTLKLPMAIYMLDYYLPMLSPNDGYNETGLTMQSAGPVREEWQPIYMSYLYQGSRQGGKSLMSS